MMEDTGHPLDLFPELQELRVAYSHATSAKHHFESSGKTILTVDWR